MRRYATDLAFMDREFSDIDVVGLSRESARLRRAVAELGYAENRHVSEATGGAQLQYLRPASPLESHAHMTKRPRPRGLRNEAHSAADHLDVFLDAMRMDHDVDLRYRLGIDPYAISPADILLTKLQIGRAAEKDVRDVVALLKDVPLGETDDAACIDARRLAVACAADWGLWFDITGNLRVVAAMIADYELDDDARTRVEERVLAVQEAITRQPKSLRFRLRARLGTRLPWRHEVEEREGSATIAPPTAA